MPSDKTKAFCRYRRSEICAHQNDLSSHASTTKHLKNAAPFSSCRTLVDMGCTKVAVDNSVKMDEMKVDAHIACHSSIATVDHLGEL